MSIKRSSTRARPPLPANPPAPNPRFSTDLHDPPFWQSGLMFGDKIQRLCTLSPQKAQAIHVLVDLALREVWWQTARTSEGLSQLLTLTRDSDEGRDQ
jgi:hypothetical protein